MITRNLVRRLSITTVALFTILQLANAQVKPAKRWDTIAALFKLQPEAATAMLAKLKFEASAAGNMAAGWRSFLDRRTLYMEPGGGMMHDSLLLYYKNDSLMMVCFLFGNDNGDPQMAGNDLKLFATALKKEKYTETIQRPNEYAEKRQYSNTDSGVTITADLWLQDGLAVIVRMQVYRSDINPQALLVLRHQRVR